MRDGRFYLGGSEFMMDAINIFTIGEWGSVIHEWVNKINGELGVYLIFLLLGTGLFFT